MISPVVGELMCLFGARLRVQFPTLSCPVSSPLFILGFFLLRRLLLFAELIFLYRIDFLLSN